MARPKKYGWVMQLAEGDHTHIEGVRAEVERAVRGYGKRCKPPRIFYFDKSSEGPGFVFVARDYDSEPQA